nr:hypothetical protein CR513_61608 [Ipomoea trifida]
MKSCTFARNGAFDPFDGALDEAVHGGHRSERELRRRDRIHQYLKRNGSQNEVAALRTIPGGLPGSSMLFLVITRTSSAPLPDNVVHVWAVEAPTPAQKLITILSASFSMLFLPSGLVITAFYVIN